MRICAECKVTWQNGSLQALKGFPSQSGAISTRDLAADVISLPSIAVYANQGMFFVLRASPFARIPLTAFAFHNFHSTGRETNRCQACGLLGHNMAGRIVPLIPP